VSEGPTTIEEMTRQLLLLGVEPGGVLVVHSAFSRIRPVENGPLGVIAALRAAVGPAGTLVLPSMADENDPPFDVLESPCLGMGAIANTFWQMPGVLRSDSPHSFAAAGPRAAEITAAHPVEIPHGPDSPPGRAHELDSQILLLGVGHDANTTIHVAENIAGVPYRLQTYSTVFREGLPVRVDYAEVDHCCENFRMMDDWLEDTGAQRRGKVGHAEARLSRSREVVAAALKRLRDDPLVFLHPLAACGECDDARRYGRLR